MYLPEKPPYEQKKSPFNGAIIAALIIVPFAFLTMKTAISSKSTRATSQPENAQVPWYTKKPDAGTFERAHQGDRKAQFLVGRYYMHQDDWENAVKWYTLSANQGHPKSQNNLGLAFLEGRDVPKNAVIGCKYMKLSYEQMRTPESADNVAVCHDQQGKGTPADMRIAFEHYLAAAEGGIAQAQFAVGEMYYRDEGTDKRQPEKAVYWYRKAAEQEYVKAIADLAKMHWRGDELPVRKENAIAA
ncbi:tetratricopeptide repeat protein [Kingella negevensis]|uniref:tetratricopeptide repeat protein n=1 Tax=Kingella negevensis TaxID=1522312 RepID=UPI00254ACD6D|nr:tetratricopeptide repeat protein [Kingella negevensis]MDK4707040.1 tetratricopeptide repeat protein [Kingella negevensis]MDK4710620.1 tetratricopeptide repeat protein [Kingella negevensis]